MSEAHLTRLAAVRVLLTLAALLCVRAAPAAAPPSSPPCAKQLAKLVADLGADDFATREAAARALEGVGAEAVPALRVGMASADPEVRSRSLTLALKAEQHTAAYFAKLGADVQRDSTTGRVKIVSYTHRDASKLTDAHLRELIGLPWLNRVWLNNAKVGDAGMVHVGRLTKLDILDLDGTRVTDAGLAHLAGLTTLESLTLSKTPVTGRGLVHLKPLKKLKSLWLSGSKVTDAGLAAGLPGLKRLEGLRSLGLSDNPITDDGLATLAGIEHPIGFDLRDTRVTDKALAYLRRMPNPLGLNLSGLPITDKGCGYLAEIKTLTGLILNETRITAAGLRKLKDLPQLKGLRFINLGLSEEEEKSVLDVMPRRVMLTGNYLSRGCAGGDAPGHSSPRFTRMAGKSEIFCLLVRAIAMEEVEE